MTDTRAPQQWMKEAANEGYEAFNQWVEKLLRFSDVPPAHELKDNLAAIIAAHCPRQEAQWISVEEKLPEHNNEYLVVEHGDIYAIPADWIVGEWFTVRGFGYESETRELHNVTHWMPLPSAPSVEAGLSDTKEK